MSTPTHEHVNVFSNLRIVESLLEKPLRVKGLAISVGMSRNQAIYTAEELKSFAKKLLGAPIYIEHVRADAAIGKVTDVSWDGRNLWFEGEIFDEDWAAKIKAGLIKHVSVGYDFKTMDIVNGHIPHGLGDAELSLVAVAGVPNANIEPILENIGTESYSPPFSLAADSGKLETGMDVLKRRCGVEWIANVERQLAAHPMAVKYSIRANPENLTRDQIEVIVKNKVHETLGVSLSDVARERLSHTKLDVVFERAETHTNESVPETMSDVPMSEIMRNIEKKNAEKPR
jgi:hypothetical protein